MNTMPTDPLPVPVAIVAPDPIPVVVAQDSQLASEKTRERVQRQGTDPSLAATTTFQQDLIAAGQRDINRVWETTQMKIALSVIWAALLVSIVLSIGGKILGQPDIQLAAVVFIFGVANLVTGFYFGRTNHQRSGGVGGDVAGSR